MVAFTRRGVALTALATLLGPEPTHAQAWPTRPIRVVIPFAPGGSTDAHTRPVLERLHARFGQPFVIDNRGGAGSAIGTALVAAAPPDGYTLLSTTASFVTAPAVQQTGYQVASFDTVAMLTRSPFAVIVPANSPAKSLHDLIAMAKQRGDRMFYATAGAGSSTHFISEYFNMRAGTRMQHVPYRGIGPAMIGLLGGDVQVILTTPASAAGQMRDGLVRVLAYTAEGRPPDSPEAPTVRQTGLDYEAESWWAIFGPRGMPREIRQTLNDAINQILRDPEIIRTFNTLGSNPSPMSLDDFTKLVNEESARWAEVARVARIRVD
ncbi:tripartite tricarboxylate transporter substrate binding protein [Roseomonas sp. AR75]|uniref:Bug family tripartite tricarboxylate transporter substrate binding protein n=1 Tax=Roseomonas sp. AR75 TaxID=2562311 RepID=UPI0010C0B024|nr:tripartite tricarboxylate transporter substrate binding protein [Roseomonas sp. AR75]